MKRISVKLVETTIDPFSIQVNPGDTAGDILSRLNLGAYVLAMPPASCLRNCFQSAPTFPKE